MSKKAKKTEPAEKQAEAESEAAIKTIVKGPRPEATAAIAACENTNLLEFILLPPDLSGIKGKIATWRITAIVARVKQLKAETGTPTPATSNTETDNDDRSDTPQTG